jgi:hypothetical protein
MCGFELSVGAIAAALGHGPPVAAAKIAAALCASCVASRPCLQDAAERLHDVADALEGIAERG